ncbi:hypothetical protein [Mesorhizobium sp. SP-1A]|uniref:hypothetical protein n=1 Tax=Mesorhizobium sp. SP-1A TaxID=3077840 RepID=UPI0028F6C40A|nr:hypothetical protein [Mesorhizobium sp. SP-1A]
MHSAKLVGAIALIGGLMSFATPSFSYPVAPGQPAHTTATPLEQVGWRCGGPGWVMNRWGRCVPRRPAPRNWCGRGFHLTPRGVCVRNRPVARACPRGLHLSPRGYCVRNW